MYIAIGGAMERVSSCFLGFVSTPALIRSSGRELMTRSDKNIAGPLSMPFSSCKRLGSIDLEI